MLSASGIGLATKLRIFRGIYCLKPFRTVDPLPSLEFEPVSAMSLCRSCPLSYIWQQKQSIDPRSADACELLARKASK